MRPFRVPVRRRRARVSGRIQGVSDELKGQMLESVEEMQEKLPNNGMP